ncbi:hypothetical protein [Nonomuraea salmonea]|uniref:sirohydrochlorin chelatase n=1 Tax=Nonomuraea salmonea TaxID=46181 RepID=UPI002FEB406E
MKPPLLLIGQGSQDDAYAAEFGRFVHRLRCRLDQTGADVSGGYLERATPRLSDSVASLVARGAPPAGRAAAEPQQGGRGVPGRDGA